MNNSKLARCAGLVLATAVLFLLCVVQLSGRGAPPFEQHGVGAPALRAASAPFASIQAARAERGVEPQPATGGIAGACSPCQGDLTDDGAVNVFDLLAMLSCWGPVAPGCECADLTGAGAVNVFDLLQLLSNWGPCPDPPDPTGACCIDIQSCKIVTEADCVAIDGEYFGDGASCDPCGAIVDPPCDYQYQDGPPGGAVGLGEPGVLIWLQRMEMDLEFDQVWAIQSTFGFDPENAGVEHGDPVGYAIYDVDPETGGPGGLLYSNTTWIDETSIGTGEKQLFFVPGLPVTDAFFIGVYVTDPGGSSFPAPTDVMILDQPENVWVAAHSVDFDEFDPTDPLLWSLPPTPLISFGIEGVWVLCATGGTAAVCPDGPPCPAIMCALGGTALLDEEGEFAVPDWTDSKDNALKPYLLDYSQWKLPIVIEQDPPPGVVLEGPQNLQGTICISDVSGQEECCSFEIELLDRDPPTVEIAGVEEGGIYTANDPPVPSVVVQDAVDPSPQLEIYLNGEEFEVGTPVSEPGFYLLVALATDGSGNVGEASVHFEVREHPLLEAVAVLADLECIPDYEEGEWEEGKFVTLTATVYLASSEFDVRDINLYSVMLWSENEDDFALHRGTVSLAGSAHPDGGYNYETVQATYQNGYWILNFSVSAEDEAIIACPDVISITATGNHTLPNEFDVVAKTDAVVDPDPSGTICNLGLCNDDRPEAAPPAEQCPPCKWKIERVVIRGNSSKNREQTCDNRRWVSWDVAARGAWIRGHMNALDICSYWTPGNATKSIARSGRGSFRLFLEMPPGCCTECLIECGFQPEFHLRVERKGRASWAIAAGKISIASSCGCSALAARALQLGGPPKQTIVVGAQAGVNKDGPAIGANVNQTVEYVADGTEKEGVATANPPGLCDTSQCFVNVGFTSYVELETTADKAYGEGSASANALLSLATAGISIHANCVQGECAGTQRSVEYEGPKSEPQPDPD